MNAPLIKRIVGVAWYWEFGRTEDESLLSRAHVRNYFVRNRSYSEFRYHTRANYKSYGHVYRPRSHTAIVLSRPTKEQVIGSIHSIYKAKHFKSTFKLTSPPNLLHNEDVFRSRDGDGLDGDVHFSV